MVWHRAGVNEQINPDSENRNRGGVKVIALFEQLMEKNAPLKFYWLPGLLKQQDETKLVSHPNQTSMWSIGFSSIYIYIFVIKYVTRTKLFHADGQTEWEKHDKDNNRIS